MGLFNRKKKEAEEAKKAAELAESQAKAEAAREKRAQELADKEAAKVKAEADAKAAALKKEADAKKEKLLEAQEKSEELKAKRAAETEARKEAKEALEAATIKHVWTNEDTYAKLAFKHYGSIKKPFYMLIYEHNKAIIGDNMNSIKTGTEIEIPPLPKELEDQK